MSIENVKRFYETIVADEDFGLRIIEISKSVPVGIRVECV